MSDGVAGTLAVIQRLHADRWFAHHHLFPHRHLDASCEAHREIVAHIHNRVPRFSIEGFRGLGKSTLLEEGTVILACLRQFHNLVIVGASYTRACDRLAAVKREFEINDAIHDTFRLGRGPVWQEGKIVLDTGICIQALGRDQSTVGIKHLDWRPDAALIDDVEDPEEVRTDAEREQTWNWFLKTFLPSLDHPLYSWVRVLGTRRGSGSLPERLENDGWPTAKYPVEHADEGGERRATWEAKFPLPVIDRMRQDYRGDMHTWMQEYMCQASSEADRIFNRSQIRVVPRVKSWEAVYAMIDPARTAHQRSATTGWAAWSWVRNRLVVWAADGALMLPDEIVALAFDIAERFDPVEIGFEEDGLNEWALQPMRQEAAKRGVFLPLKPMRAPRGKTQFIGGLQPFFNAGEVELVQNMPVLTDQLLSFPTGRIDVPNALAYALLMRPGLPIYENFSAEHIAEQPEYDKSRPLFLAANATQSMLAAALVQMSDGRLVVLADWVREGLPAELAADVWGEASGAADSTGRASVARPRAWEDMLKTAMPDEYLLRRLAPVWLLPPRHQDRWMNVGLLQAVRRIPAEARIGGQETDGRVRLSELLSIRVRGMPMVEVSPHAKWTLRALAGGYTRGMAKGRLKDEAEPGPYRVLMEGIESAVAMLHSKLAIGDEDEDRMPNISYDRMGRPYKSAMPARRER